MQFKPVTVAKQRFVAWPTERSMRFRLRLETALRMASVEGFGVGRSGGRGNGP